MSGVSESFASLFERLQGEALSSAQIQKLYSDFRKEHGKFAIRGRYQPPGGMRTMRFLGYFAVFQVGWAKGIPGVRITEIGHQANFSGIGEKVAPGRRQYFGPVNDPTGQAQHLVKKYPEIRVVQIRFKDPERQAKHEQLQASLVAAHKKEANKLALAQQGVLAATAEKQSQQAAAGSIAPVSRSPVEAAKSNKRMGLVVGAGAAVVGFVALRSMI